jgi:hypothetical protein
VSASRWASSANHIYNRGVTYSVDVTELLQPGANRILIQAANTAINYMAGRSLSDYRLLNQLYGKRFDPQDMDKIRPIESGLLGPIRLLSLKEIEH